MGNAEDLIPRSAALKSLGEPPQVWQESDYEIGMQVQWTSDFNAIKSVPPAQQDHIADADKKVDLISRQAAIAKITEYGSGDVTFMSVGELKRRIEQLPAAQSEHHEIGYSECVYAMFRMWNDNILTNSEYRHIMVKLNTHWAERREE